MGCGFFFYIWVLEFGVGWSILEGLYPLCHLNTTKIHKIIILSKYNLENFHYLIYDE